MVGTILHTASPNLDFWRIRGTMWASKMDCSPVLSQRGFLIKPTVNPVVKWRGRNKTVLDQNGVLYLCGSRLEYGAQGKDQKDVESQLFTVWQRTRLETPGYSLYDGL